MISFIRWLAMVLIAAAIGYLGTGFVSMQWDVTKWDESWRASLLFGAFVLGTLAFIIRENMSELP